MLSHPSPLLAFGFASPFLLWGLALAGIPILIHLLYKRRYVEVPWAAMRFLLSAAKKNSRRIRLEQLLLLAVRTLILLLLAAALARPFLETLGAYFQADVPAHRILVVDVSYSMGYRAAEQSRFERAREVGRQIAASSRQGDALNLVRISGSPPHAVIQRPTFQHAQVAEEISQLRLTEERGSLVAALASVRELLREAPEIARKEVFVLSDFQQEDWLLTGSEAAALRETLQQVSGRSELTLIDVAAGEAPNSAVTALSFEEPLVTIGRPVVFRAGLRHFGPLTLSDQPVELAIDGRLAETRRIDLPPGAEVPVDFTHVFAAGGEHTVEVRLEPDLLPLDDVRRLSVPVREQLQVLLVNGKPSGEAMGNATDYVRLALAPLSADRPTAGLVRPHVIPEGELTSTDLARYDCIFLCNVGMFTAREADLLRAYAQGGGGLVFCLGDQVRPDNYNQVLSSEGAGVLPAKLGEVAGSARSTGEAFQFDTASLAHPIVRPFAGNPGAGLEATNTFAYVRAEPAGEAQVALKFSSGDPAIVTAPVGRGRVVLVTTSVDREWSTWAVFGHSLVPLVHEIVEFAVSGERTERQLTIGQPLTETFATRALDMPVSLELPDGTRQPLPTEHKEGFSNVSFDAVETSGFYKLHLGPPLGERLVFAANSDPRESNLAKVTEDRLRTDVLTGADFSYRTQWEDLGRTGEGPVTERGGMIRWLLLTVFCLLIIEHVMAWNFLGGILLLYAAAAVAVTIALMQASLVYGTLAAVVLAGGLAALIVFNRGALAALRRGPR